MDTLIVLVLQHLMMQQGWTYFLHEKMCTEVPRALEHCIYATPSLIVLSLSSYPGNVDCGCMHGQTILSIHHTLN